MLFKIGDKVIVLAVDENKLAILGDRPEYAYRKGTIVARKETSSVFKGNHYHYYVEIPFFSETKIIMCEPEDMATMEKEGL